MESLVGPLAGTRRAGPVHLEENPRIAIDQTQDCLGCRVLRKGLERSVRQPNLLTPPISERCGKPIDPLSSSIVDVSREHLGQILVADILPLDKPAARPGTLDPSAESFCD